jgi:PAS domain S-box-containing protein
MPLRPFQGSPAKVQSVNRDGELFHAIASVAQDAIILTDVDGCVRFWNDSATRIFGWRAEEAIGKDAHLLLAPPDLHRRYVQAAQQFRKSGRGAVVGRTIELRALRKDGCEIPIELSLSALRIRGGWGAVAIMRDISERKEAERIQRERHALQEAIQAMEKVLAVVGHELRTPLAAMRATAEFLLTPEAQELGEWSMFLGNIHAETIRMASIVNDMLEAARLNAGCVRWDWTTIKLEAVCDSALSVVRPLIDHSRVEISCNVTPPGLAMRGDAEAIQRLIINLVTNSAKHTSDGSIAIATTESPRAAGRWIMLEVRDTGEGIPEAMVEKLGRAYVLSSGMIGSDYVKGAGLGLAICKAIVAVHGGSMSVQSRPGQGSVFTVHMPADLEGPVDPCADREIVLESAT